MFHIYSKAFLELRVLTVRYQDRLQSHLKAQKSYHPPMSERTKDPVTRQDFILYLANAEQHSLHGASAKPGLPPHTRLLTAMRGLC